MRVCFMVLPNLRALVGTSKGAQAVETFTLSRERKKSTNESERGRWKLKNERKGDIPRGGVQLAFL